MMDFISRQIAVGIKVRITALAALAGLLIPAGSPVAQEVVLDSFLPAQECTALLTVGDKLLAGTDNGGVLDGNEDINHNGRVDAGEIDPTAGNGADGVDSDGDGSVDSYISAPTAAEMETTVSVRVFMLGRTTDEDGGYTNDKTYTLSNATSFAPDDSFRRRVYMTTVSVPNVRNRMLIGL